MCYCHGREVVVSKSVNNPDYSRLKFSKVQSRALTMQQAHLASFPNKTHCVMLATLI